MQCKWAFQKKILSRFTGVYLVFEVFQTRQVTRVARLFLPCSHKNDVVHIIMLRPCYLASPRMGCCEKVLHFMGREVKGRYQFRMQAVKCVVAKLQGVKTASFCKQMSGREVTGR